MAAAKPWTTEDDQQLRDLHAAETSVRAMATALGRGRSSVDRRLKHLGLRSTRTNTVAATAANMADAKSRRAALEVNLLEDAERLRQQLWQPHKYIDHGGKDYLKVEWTQPEPSPTDKLKLMQAATAALDRSIKISVHDADTGHIEALGMLDGIAAAIEAAAAGMDEPA